MDVSVSNVEFELTSEKRSSFVYESISFSPFLFCRTNVIFLQVIPCALLALIVHPNSQHFRLYRILWAFCVYLESVSVLPQLRMMQNAKV